MKHFIQRITNKATVTRRAVWRRSCVRIFTLIATASTVSGCATGTTTFFESQPATVQCSEATILAVQNVAVSGAVVLHYVVPFGYHSYDYAKEGLSLVLRFSTLSERQDIPAGALEVSIAQPNVWIPVGAMQHYSSRSTAKGHVHTYVAKLPGEAQGVDTFTLRTLQPLYGCAPSIFTFTRKSSFVNRSELGV